MPARSDAGRPSDTGEAAQDDPRGQEERMENPRRTADAESGTEVRVWFLRLLVGVCGGAPAQVGGGRPTGPRPSTARQGRAQCRGSGRKRPRAAAGGALIHQRIIRQHTHRNAW
jgi:hypothetical protein